jgi:uncharacterized protein (TIGR00255 family)
MTGFARADGEHDSVTWVWEAKSVNGRGLDVRCRAPAGMDALEAAAKKAAADQFSRGSVNLNLQISRTSGEADYVVNRAALDRLVAVAGDYADRPGVAPARLDGLMALRGVIEAVEPADDEHARTAREAAILASLAEALSGLAAARAEEGGRIAAVLAAQIDDIERLVNAARSQASTQPKALRTRLAAQVAAIMEAGVEADPDRIAQEAALLAVKVDIVEEIDRLDGHVASARDLLRQGGVIGRRLDFLAQEFNREANTLCAKSADQDLTRIGLDLKTVIDRLREQVQNIE